MEGVRGEEGGREREEVEGVREEEGGRGREGNECGGKGRRVKRR